ncbi:MAG: hypothetical protein ICV81_08110 [Flavisolibacter sp.]|nr:hypothetical protein [Flavisolibacter sp.]
MQCAEQLRSLSTAACLYGIAPALCFSTGEKRLSSAQKGCSMALQLSAPGLSRKEMPPVSSGGKPLPCSSHEAEDDQLWANQPQQCVLQI